MKRLLVTIGIAQRRPNMIQVSPPRRQTVIRSTLLAVAGLAAAAIAALPASAAQPQSVRISSFLYGVPDPADPTNPNLFSVSGCWAASGAIADEGGRPIMDREGNIVGCGSPSGIAGTARFDGLGHLKTGGPNVLQATHRMFGTKGTFDIDFEGKYLPIELVGGRLLASTGPGGGWQITGGTGAYEGLQGTGTSTAVADFTDAFAGIGPVTVRHIETGDVHWTSQP
jgi:hypothetical protein